MISEGSRVGKYELKQKLGEGGFGQVFRARDTALGRDCALKFLLPEHTTKTDLLQRFLQEARSAAAIVHGGIVTVFECGVFEGGSADGTAYIAMELLQGESLSKRLERGAIPPELAIEIARQVASALGAAHAAGIVHRDLKPDNVWLVPDVASAIGLRAKVLDFGIAKLAEGQPSGVHTATVQIFGTPHYMSPEQCRSTAGVDGRSDIYALGVMLFEMLVGGRPFEGPAGVLIAAHQLLPPPTLRTVKPELDPGLEALVGTMLAKEVTDRPQTMDDVMAHLEPMRRPSGVHTAPPISSPHIAPADPTRALRPASSPSGSSPSGSAPPATTPGLPSNVVPPSQPPAVGSAPSLSTPSQVALAPTEVPVTVAPPPRGRAKLWFALAGIASAGAAVAVFVVVSKKSSSDDRQTAAASPPKSDAKTEQGAMGSGKSSGSAPPASGSGSSSSGSAAILPRKRPDPKLVYAMPLGTSPIIVGSVTAPVTIVEGADYACELCGDVQETVAAVRKRYGDDVRVVYKPNIIKPGYRSTAYGACAAGKQRKFVKFDEDLWAWELWKPQKEADKVDLMVEHADGSKKLCWLDHDGCPQLTAIATDQGLDVPKFIADTKKCAAEVDVGVEDWHRFGVASAPAFFINGRFLPGAAKVAAFVKIIDEELATAKDRIAQGSPAESYYKDWVLAKGLTETELQ